MTQPRKARRMSVCHVALEWDDGFAFWSQTWCGRRRFIEHGHQSSPAEQKRLEAQEARNRARPWKHCPKCVKARKRAQPDWHPMPEEPA